MPDVGRLRRPRDFSDRGHFDKGACTLTEQFFLPLSWVHVKGEWACQPLGTREMARGRRRKSPELFGGSAVRLLGRVRPQPDYEHQAPHCYSEVPRVRTGSPRCALVSRCSGCFADGEPGAEIYSGRADREHAARSCSRTAKRWSQVTQAPQNAAIYTRSIVVPSTGLHRCLSARRADQARAQSSHGLSSMNSCQPTRGMGRAHDLNCCPPRHPVTIAITTAGLRSQLDLLGTTELTRARCRDGIILPMTPIFR